MPKDVVWKTPLPGKGHASPIIWKDRIFTVAALEGSQERVLISIDRPSGKILWQKTVLKSPVERIHKLNSLASSTPVTDGEAYLVALDRTNGKTIWKTPRPNKTRSYCTPIIRQIDGRTQMILSGSKSVASYDPDSGKQHWIIDGPTEQFVASLVYNGELLFMTCGFPERHMLAIKPDGKGNVTDPHVVWRETRNASYVPSPVAIRDYFLVVSDSGRASCFEAKEGDLMWNERLPRRHSASAIAANGLAYFLSDQGIMSVIRPGEDFDLVAQSELGVECNASPLVFDGKFYIRGDKHLFCIGATVGWVSDPSVQKFTMNYLLPTAITLVCAISAFSADLPRSEPEAEGVSSAQLLDLVDTLDRKIDGMHSVMVLRHGSVIAEGWWAPYASEHNHVLYSLSKSFTSTAVGFAVAEGKLDIFDPVLKFFPEDAPADPSGNLKAMRVRDLLTMSTGHQDEPPTSPDKMSTRSFLAHPVPHKPGTHFRYNTAATFMQSAIVQKVTGQTVLDYLKPRLFEPLGIADPKWDTNIEGISLGGYGLRVKTEDIAKLGQLYLQKGKWNGKQLLSEKWVEMATSRQMSNGSNPDGDWDQGYGFQFWRCRHNGYRGDGAFGQYCVVMPDEDMVVAITSGVNNMGAILDVIWDKLLPAAGKEELATDADGLAVLRKRLAGLALPYASGIPASKSAGNFIKQSFQFPANKQGLESLQLVPADDGKSLRLVTKIGGVESSLLCGYGKWSTGRVEFTAGHLANFPNEPIASSFAWEHDNTCVIKQFAFETPFSATLKLTFSNDQVTLERTSNVAFGSTKWTTLVGTRK